MGQFDFMTVFLISTLIGVIIIQAVERYFYADQQQKELSRLIAAVLSRNTNEYRDVLREEKEKPKGPTPPPDEVDLSQADDETFEKFIKSQS